MALPVSPSVSPTPSADCVTRALGRLTLAEQAGQLLMVGTGVDAPSGLGDSVRRYNLGGVFLHGRSTRDAAALRADIAVLQKRAALPLLVSLDQEGGSVQTLKGPDFPRLPSAQKLGAAPAATIRDTTRDSARRLAGIGVNINLAPVADTVPAALGEGNPPIGYWHRQFGSDPALVAADMRAVVPASQDAGVLTTLKHFPGLGRVRANTDTSTKAVDATATANDPYLEPFRAGIESGSAAVMISSASYPRLDDDAIAAFSKPIVTGLLRDRLGFRGLIMSDDLGAAVALNGVPVGERAVRFIAAGGDQVLTIRPPDAAPMVAALIDRAGHDAAFRSRVTDAAQHVLRAKERAGLLRC
ncbi:glycoside hydrolase family 3 protein [Actinoplanes sp. KI2]|uniref:glycoside hydrolase family 3 N-terminal domain-containing protein n=1 Tax=Actinoplanes sp. KI2 TaxID=2983315 RepID=UPI0021D5F2B7|nr:glycoside hydrolase family 3 N-terminal domain-containing protein [Actinoplanes sp. KI2]MCU7727400.1 glycoside hydrolase family 3 protein [Actinoplanes sp. KI2]